MVGRTRTFDERAVILAAAALFRDNGYHGVGVDALLNASGLHRGSLYKAFGNKQGLFVAVLTDAIEHRVGSDQLDILIVALVDLAPRNRKIRDQLAAALRSTPDIAAILGQRLIDRSGIRIGDSS